MVKADYKSIEGDSGEPVTIVGFAGVSWDSSIIGIQSASALANNSAWVPGASYSIFSKVTNICNSLGVTAYSD